MGHHVEHKMTMAIPANQVWAVLNDFGGIEKFAVTIDKSPILDGKETGLGAKRKCIFHNGTSVVEEIIDYEEGKRIQVILSEHTLPLKTATTTMTVAPVDANTSDVSMSMDFVVKGGLLGQLIGLVMMRPVMKGVFKKLLKGLAYHAKTGELIGQKLPSEKELTLALST